MVNITLTHNFTSIIKMPNVINDFKKYLKFLTSEKQLCEINQVIEKFNKYYLPCPNINKKFNTLNQLKNIRRELLTNHKLH